MGNKQKESNFDMNIQIIGERVSEFYQIIKTTSRYKTIKDYWNFYYEEDMSLDEQVQNYFDKLEKEKENFNNNMKETLIIKVNSLKDNIIDKALDRMNNMNETYFMPLVLLLFENNNDNIQKFELDEEKYDCIDPRLIFIEKYEVNKAFIEDKIEPILLRFCSIHNELGDRIEINQKESFDLIDNYFPFNLNIACLGRFGQGKSTGVNMILKEYKAKESSKGSSQTKSLTFYQVSNQPIRLLDIPGFEDNESVNKAIEKLRICGEKINQIKDNIHIFLYFFNYNNKRAFMTLEKPLLIELLKHNSSKIIYVITNSIPNMKEKQIKNYIQKINSGLQKIFEINNINENNENIMNYNKLKASKDNTVFVNFLKDKNHNIEPFGIDRLFQKIHDFFKDSEDCRNLLEKLDQKKIDEKAAHLREQAKDVLLANKIWGGVVGIIPGVDLLCQHFLIKRNAVKKVGSIYGIDVKFIEENKNIIKEEKAEIKMEMTEIKKDEIKEDEEKENLIKEEKEDEIKNEINKDFFRRTSFDRKKLTLEVQGEDLTKESNKIKIGKGIKITSETGAYVGSGLSIGNGIGKIVVDFGANAISFGINILGIGLAALGASVGVGLGAYLTHKYCEELIDKFETYYKQNAEKINNSYIQALKYFNQNKDEWEEGEYIFNFK